MLRKILASHWIPPFLMVLATSGCDERATPIAREAADRQAQQNTAMADLNQHVATGTERLVAADAEARQEVFKVHHDLQAERERLDVAREALESDRRQIAGERHSDSIWAPLASAAGGLLLVSLLLGFCWYALAASHAADIDSGQLSELLVTEILAAESQALTGGADHSVLLGDHRLAE